MRLRIRESLMLKTRITEMLNIEYPIIQGGMMWLATAAMRFARVWEKWVLDKKEH